jgi:hypothetical protein
MSTNTHIFDLSLAEINYFITKLNSISDKIIVHRQFILKITSTAVTQRKIPD